MTTKQQPRHRHVARLLSRLLAHDAKRKLAHPQRDAALALRGAARPRDHGESERYEDLGVRRRVDRAQQLGADADVGAPIASDRAAARSRAPLRSRTAGVLLATQATLSASAVAVHQRRIAHARAACDRAAELLDRLAHPAADRIHALGEDLHPQITDAQATGVADALRHEAYRMQRDADFLQSVILSPDFAQDNCRFEDRLHPFFEPDPWEVYPWDGEPADWHGQLTPLRDTPREDNAAWREHVITQERAERDSATGVTTKPAVT